MSRNIHTIEANREVTPTEAFEATFAPLHVDEVLLEFDPKKSGPPVAVLSGDGGAHAEFHLLPQRGREGRFAHHTGGGTAFSAIRVHLAPRGKTAKLVRVKLIAKGAT